VTSPAPAATPLNVRVEDLQSGVFTEHVFKRSPVRVGRNALNELSLQAPFVSLSHAVLRFQGERVEIIDLGSTNGVQVDGKRIEANVPVLVTAEADVRIGALRFHFGRPPTDAPSAAREQTEFRRATAEIRLTPGPHGILLPPELRTPAQRTVVAPAAGRFVLASPEKPATGLSPTPRKAPQPEPLKASEGAAAPKVEVVKLGAAPEAAAASVVLPTPAALALAASVDDVYPLYAEYRKAWLRVQEAIAARSTGLPRPEQLKFSELLEARMPGLRQEEQFRALAGATVRATGPSGPLVEGQRPASAGVPTSSEQRALLQVFAHTYAGTAELGSNVELERLLERVSEVLESFATAFLELRKGQAEFGEGIAVRAVTSETALRRSRSPQELLRLLLDPGTDGAARIDDLTGGFAEVMIHQVAMLGATRQGIRAMLERLDPQKIQNPLAWPVRFLKRWQRFESVWGALAEEEHAAQVVFGPEFARSYAMVMGGHVGQPSGTAVPHGRVSGKVRDPGSKTS
jgi:type VI secretion system protein